MSSMLNRLYYFNYFICCALLLGTGENAFSGPLNGFSWVGPPAIVKTSTSRHAGDEGLSCGSDFEMCIGQASKTTGAEIELKTVKCFIPKNTVTCPTNAQLDTLTGERKCVVAADMTRESNNNCRETGGPTGPCYCREFNQQKNSSTACYNDLATYRRSHNCSKIGEPAATADDVSKCRWACTAPHASTTGNCARIQCANDAVREEGGHSQYCFRAVWTNATGPSHCATYFSATPYWNPTTSTCSATAPVETCENVTCGASNSCEVVAGIAKCRCFYGAELRSPGTACPTACPSGTLMVSGTGACVSHATYCANVGAGGGATNHYCAADDTCYMSPLRVNGSCPFGAYNTTCGFPLACYHAITTP